MNFPDSAGFQAPIVRENTDGKNQLKPAGNTVETQYIASLLEARKDFPTTLSDSAMGR